MMQVRAKPLVGGIATYIPAVAGRHKGTGGTVSARYCYSVWLRHLVKAEQSGLPTDVKRVAELGPGDSLGIGLAAMLTGVEEYYAFDVVHYAFSARNLAILEELLELFSQRAPIPDAVEFPRIRPTLSCYDFPASVLTEERLKRVLCPERVATIREALLGNPSPCAITYVAPWHDPSLIAPGRIDMAYSQAVMEHVDDVPGTYQALKRWLRPGGFMSHSIDFSSHGYTRAWNGQYAVSDVAWKLLRGRRAWLINRVPFSGHQRFLSEAGFRVVGESHTTGPALPRNLLAPRFRDLSDSDLTTRNAFVQAVAG
ncbi:MAG TPA: methyltransferase domain-containing protein [Armatimonadota bacterium]|jgi:hypothetical protein